MRRGSPSLRIPTATGDFSHFAHARSHAKANGSCIEKQAVGRPPRPPQGWAKRLMYKRSRIAEEDSATVTPTAHLVNDAGKPLGELASHQVRPFVSVVNIRIQ
jgi:hypothetical protein